MEGNFPDCLKPTVPLEVFQQNTAAPNQGVRLKSQSFQQQFDQTETHAH